jgi:hypothetical protein
MPRPKATPNPLKQPPRAVSEAIIRRFLKVGQTPYWPREMVTWARLWKRYPNVAFWQGYELPFGDADGGHALNMLSWFETEEGVKELDRAWLLFHYTPPPLTEPDQAGYDDGAAIPPPPVIPRRARTVAEMFKT